MNLNPYQNLTTDLASDSDFLLDDEALTSFLEDLYCPKALKKDRIKRF